MLEFKTSDNTTIYIIDDNDRELIFYDKNNMKQKLKKDDIIRRWGKFKGVRR